MWRMIKRESNDHSGYHYIKYSNSETDWGGIEKESQSFISGVEVAFINLGHNLKKNADGDYIKGRSQAVITENWCSGNDVNPDVDDFIYDSLADRYYRIVGVENYVRREGLYILDVEVDEI